MPNTNTKNFTYSSNETGTGIKAQSLGKYRYILEMPSYKDGRLCCNEETKEDCAKLNRDYPLCSELIARADYQNGMECAGPGQPTPPTSFECLDTKPETLQQCANGCGQQTRTVSCDTSTGKWITSPWEGDCVCDCAEPKPKEVTVCNLCGEKTRSVTCDKETGNWVTGDWSDCSKTSAECMCATKPASPIQQKIFMWQLHSLFLVS